jgi:hypothetical protein
MTPATLPTAKLPTFCLKIDVDTHDGMRDGVPRLLALLAEFKLRATFFLSFGPDNAGKAIWNVLRRPGFLKKMVRTGAPSLYGWRTILSGTLLPARMIGERFPDLVRRIEAEGHEVGVHAWDHRLWQDHLETMDRAAIDREFARSFACFEKILGRRPRSVAAPAWCATRTSLQAQDALGLLYASDMRGGAPGFPVLDGYRSTTLQFPTTQPCLEELLAIGQRDLDRCAGEVLSPVPGLDHAVLPIHAEVEGGVFHGFFRTLLERMQALGVAVRTLEVAARAVLDGRRAIDPLPACAKEIPGRSGRVLTPA